jgi:hypothetical protein
MNGVQRYAETPAFWMHTRIRWHTSTFPRQGFKCRPEVCCVSLDCYLLCRAMILPLVDLSVAARISAALQQLVLPVLPQGSIWLQVRAHKNNAGEGTKSKGGFW